MKKCAPAYILSSLVLLLSILLWHGFVSRIISLDWRIGNIRPFLFTFQIILIFSSVVLIVFRDKVNAYVSDAFPTWREFLKFIRIRIIVIICWIIIAEILLTVLGLPYKVRKPVPPVPLAQFDSELGLSYRPNISVTKEYGDDKLRITMHFDSIGSRVASQYVQRDTSEPTVIFVGGSITLGQAVSYEESFPGRLDSIEGFPFQVVNLGVQGYGTDQALLLLKRRLNSFNTKAVVYGFICDHIERNAVPDRRLIYPGTRSIGTKPLFGLKIDGELFLKSRPYMYRGGPFPRLWEALKVIFYSYGPSPDLDLTKALISEMKRYTEAHGAKFIVIYWDIPWTTSGFCEPTFLDDLDLTVVNTFNNRPLGWDNWLVRGDKHPNAQAHRHVADLLFKEFKRQGLITAE